MGSSPPTDDRCWAVRPGPQLSAPGPAGGRRVWLAVVAAGLLCCTASCGSGTGSAPGSATPASSAASEPSRAPVLPPRPSDLSLIRVEPCGLLAGAQITQLGVGAGSPYGDPVLGNAECVWATPSATDTWITRALIYESAATALGDPHAQVVHVAGFPAVQTNDPTADPTHTCELYIDIAEGQTLLVAYVGGPNNPNSATSTHPLACQKAAQAADLMIQTLQTRRH